MIACNRCKSKIPENMPRATSGTVIRKIVGGFFSLNLSLDISTHFCQSCIRDILIEETEAWLDAVKLDVKNEEDQNGSAMVNEGGPDPSLN